MSVKEIIRVAKNDIASIIISMGFSISVFNDIVSLRKSKMHTIITVLKNEDKKLIWCSV